MGEICRLSPFLCRYLSLGDEFQSGHVVLEPLGEPRRDDGLECVGEDNAPVIGTVCCVALLPNGDDEVVLHVGSEVVESDDIVHGVCDRV